MAASTDRPRRPASRDHATNWTSVRGAFAVGDRLYTGRDDGRFQVRPITPACFGAPTEV